MVSLIIPVAGRSSRFPEVRPKWLLTHPSGQLMLIEAIRGLNLSDCEKIVVVMLEEHAHQYQPVDGIHRGFKELGSDIAKKLEILRLPEPTRHQPETIAKAIRHLSITGPVAIKDSDNYFRFQILPENLVSIAKLGEQGLINAGSKSYVITNYEGLVTNIVEKQVVSDQFCTGCYCFADTKEYLATYDSISEYENLYPSHIIYKMILAGQFFSATECESYQDWGTLEDWGRFKRQYATVFVDLDGVLVENGGQWLPPFWQEVKPITDNVDCVNRLYDSGKVKVLIITARPSAVRDLTLSQLKRYQIKYHDIIFDLPHAQRIIINDFSKSNPYPSCSGINVPRNSPDLRELVESFMTRT